MQTENKQILQLINQNANKLHQAIQKRYSSEVHTTALEEIASETTKYTPTLPRAIKRELSKESERFQKDDELVGLLIDDYVISARNN